MVISKNCVPSSPQTRTPSSLSGLKTALVNVTAVAQARVVILHLHPSQVVILRPSRLPPETINRDGLKPAPREARSVSRGVCLTKSGDERAIHAVARWEQRPGRLNRESCVSREKGGHDGFVFLGLQAACAVHEYAAASRDLCCGIQ